MLDFLEDPTEYDALVRPYSRDTANSGNIADISDTLDIQLMERSIGLIILSDESYTDIS